MPLDVFMRDTDAFSWYMERDPMLRATIVAIAWLEGPPDWEVLAGRLERASRRIPLFRQRVMEPPGRLATPRWTVDDGFDLTWHLRRVGAPEPRTADTVLALARTAAMTGFDRSRPLWEFTLVEHLAEDRAALIMKVHHSLTDGVGGMQLALELFDVEAAPPPAGRTPAQEGEPPPSGDGSLVGQSLAHDWQRVADFARQQAVGAVPAVLGGARHPGQRAAAVMSTVRSIARTVAPVSDIMSPVMTERGLGRHLDLLTVSLDDLKRAAAAAGGSVNDGFMAAVTGGLRRYHERHGAVPGELRVTLPISIRRPEDPVAGNRITLMRFKVPVGEPDPVARIREIGRRCRAARDEPSLAFTNAIAATLNLLPSGVVGSMLKHVDFVASDVPGFAFPVYLAGARMTGYFACGPTIGTAFNCTLLSYDGTCCVGVTADTAAIPDPDEFVACLRQGFEEVLALAGSHAPALAPLVAV